jgi:hypothetical protein
MSFLRKGQKMSVETELKVAEEKELEAREIRRWTRVLTALSQAFKSMEAEVRLDSQQALAKAERARAEELKQEQAEAEERAKEAEERAKQAEEALRGKPEAAKPPEEGQKDGTSADKK